MSTEEIKLQIFRQVDALEGARLKEFYGMMMNYLNSSKDTLDWIGVTDIEKNGIEEAIKELNENKGITHEDVMGKLKNKYIHA